MSENLQLWEDAYGSRHYVLLNAVCSLRLPGWFVLVGVSFLVVR